MGPASITNATLGADGRFPTTLAGVRVLFDNTPAPLIYVSETQLAAVVPYSVAGKTTTQLQVEVQGNRSNAVTIQVAPAAPAIFTANSSGRGQGAILNEDNSFTSAGNPAEKGSIIVLFTTGEGQTSPAGGAAPGLVAGVMQVNARILAGAPTGDVPVTLVVGTNESPAGVTVSVADQSRAKATQMIAVASEATAITFLKRCAREPINVTTALTIAIVNITPAIAVPSGTSAKT